MLQRVVLEGVADATGQEMVAQYHAVSLIPDSSE